MSVTGVKATDAGRTGRDGKERDGPIFNELTINSTSRMEKKVE
jgi:hypothetical protein